MGLFAHGWMKLTHYSILVLAKINENLLYWKKPVKFHDLHICSFFTITDCDQNYMQMLNHQINDKNCVGLCSLFSFFFSFKYFRPRPQYFDYFHIKLLDGFLFREKGLKKKRFRWARITGWFRVDGERLIGLKIYGSIKTCPNSYRYAIYKATSTLSQNKFLESKM